MATIDGKKLAILIGGKKIAESLPCSLPEFNRESPEWAVLFKDKKWTLANANLINFGQDFKIDMQYYLKRGKRYYFRSHTKKIIIDSDKDLPVKRGAVVTMCFHVTDLR